MKILRDWFFLCPHLTCRYCDFLRVVFKIELALAPLVIVLMILRMFIR